jgi:hypothetical protein
MPPRTHNDGGYRPDLHPMYSQPQYFLDSKGRLITNSGTSLAISTTTERHRRPSAEDLYKDSYKPATYQRDPYEGLRRRESRHEPMKACISTDATFQGRSKESSRRPADTNTVKMAALSSRPRPPTADVSRIGPSYCHKMLTLPVTTQHPHAGQSSASRLRRSSGSISTPQELTSYLPDIDTRKAAPPPVTDSRFFQPPEPHPNVSHVYSLLCAQLILAWTSRQSLEATLQRRPLVADLPIHRHLLHLIPILYLPHI